VRILFNRSYADGQRTGVGHYAAELFRSLEALAAPDEVLSFPSGLGARVNGFLHCHCTPAKGRAIEERCQHILASRPTGSRSPLAWLSWNFRRARFLDRSHIRLCRAGQALLQRHCRKWLTARNGDLYHEPNYIPLECDLPTIITMCDLSVLLHPEWHPAERVAFFEQQFHRGLKQCIHVLTISEFSRREIIEALGIPAERVTCTYLGARPGMRPLTGPECQPVLSRLGLSAGEYLLYVGTLEPRKNLDTLVRAYCDLPAPLRRRCPLLLAGGWGWRAEGLRQLVEGEARSRGVWHLGYAAEAELPALYSGARALTFPSLYEGFGLPPLEMLACGGAVLASTAAAVAEVLAGSRAHLVEPRDVAAWREALTRAITDEDWLAQMRQGAQQHAARFSWEACAQSTLTAYRNLKGVGLDQVLTSHRPPLAA
jgi:alpha-1,3-rhamnosyl/mannosyltransferase